MKSPLHKRFPQPVWLLLLVSALLWGQIVNAEHIHLDHHSAHECLNCQQLKPLEAMVGSAYTLVLQRDYQAPQHTTWPGVPSPSAPRFSIRAPPTP